MQRGGRYETGKDGKIKLIEPPTKDHPEGNAPRDAGGRRMDRADEAGQKG